MVPTAAVAQIARSTVLRTAIVFARNEHALLKATVVAAVGATVCSISVGAAVGTTTSVVTAFIVAANPRGAARSFASSSPFNDVAKLSSAPAAVKVIFALAAAEADTPVIVYVTWIPPARRLEVNLLLVATTSAITRVMLLSDKEVNPSCDFNVDLKADWWSAEKESTVNAVSAMLPTTLVLPTTGADVGTATAATPVYEQASEMCPQSKLLNFIRASQPGNRRGVPEYCVVGISVGK